MDLLPAPWSPLPDHPPYLIQTDFTRTHYSIRITDFHTCWSETLTQREIIDRAKQCDSPIDAVLDLDVLLSRLHRGLVRQSDRIKLTLTTKGSDALDLTTEERLDDLKLTWRFHLLPLSSSAHRQFALSLFTMIDFYQTSLTELMAVVREKDKAIRGVMEFCKAGNMRYTPATRTPALYAFDGRAWADQRRRARRQDKHRGYGVTDLVHRVGRGGSHHGDEGDEEEADDHDDDDDDRRKDWRDVSLEFNPAGWINDPDERSPWADEGKTLRESSPIHRDDGFLSEDDQSGVKHSDANEGEEREDKNVSTESSSAPVLSPQPPVSTPPPSSPSPKQERPAPNGGGGDDDDDTEDEEEELDIRSDPQTEQKSRESSLLETPRKGRVINVISPRKNKETPRPDPTQEVQEEEEEVDEYEAKRRRQLKKRKEVEDLIRPGPRKGPRKF